MKTSRVLARLQLAMSSSDTEAMNALLKELTALGLKFSPRQVIKVKPSVVAFAVPSGIIKFRSSLFKALPDLGYTRTLAKPLLEGSCYMVWDSPDATPTRIIFDELQSTMYLQT